MNKIVVINENEIINEIKTGVKAFVDDNTLTINIQGEHSYTIELINSIYENIHINLDDYTKVTLLEVKENNNLVHYNYKYSLGSNSNATISKFYHISDYKEDVVINLDGYSANVDFNMSAISFYNQSYNINVNHNNQKTVSNIRNHGVTFDDGSIDIVVNATVKKGMKDSELNQDNKVMTMGNGKSIIQPNLFVDEDMVEARHGASIGRFGEDEVFYLETRGIPSDTCYQLLLKGFLLGNFNFEEQVNMKLENIIEKVGRCKDE